MKKIIFALAMLLTTALSANAMSYEQARDQALFLTDKMAYELDLSEEQYEAAYEVNLDYLMNIRTADDLYADYWTRRNLDLSYILLDWQYRTFCGLDYFYRPLYWETGIWHFRIYAFYERRDFYYYGRPHFYHSYHGGHSWHMNGGHSWYHGRTFHHGGIGMRGGWDRGGYRGMTHGWRPGDGGHRGFDRNSTYRGSSNHSRGITDQRGNRGIGYNRNQSGADNNGYRRGNSENSGYRRGNSENSGYRRGNSENSGYRRGNSDNSSYRRETSRPSSTRETVGSRPQRSTSSSSYTPSHSFSGGSRGASTGSYSSGGSRGGGFSGGGHSGGGHSGGFSGGGHSGGHAGGGHGGGSFGGGRR